MSHRDANRAWFGGIRQRVSCKHYTYAIRHRREGYAAAVQNTAWGNAELLEENRERLTRECTQKLHEYEMRYELASGHVESEMAQGRLRETAEVCDWVMTYHLYRSLQNGR